MVSKVERPLTKEDAKVRLFQVPFQSIGISICGGKIGSSSLQACIAAVVPGTNSCSIRAHSLKAKSLVETEVYIPTPIVADRRAVYLSPSFLASDLLSKVLSSLLNAERSVKVWSSLLPSLPSLSPLDIKNLVVSIHQTAGNFKTPFKNKIASFTSAVQVDNTENLVLRDSSLRYPVSKRNTLVSVIYGHIDGLSANSENLRGDFHKLETTLVADLGELDCQFSLLRDTLGSDPGIPDVPFRNPVGGDCFLKGFIGGITSSNPPSNSKFQAAVDDNTSQ